MGRLTFRIHDTQHKEWFIQGLLPLTRIPLMQQKIANPREALEQAMRIESMTGYPGNAKTTVTGTNPARTSPKLRIKLLHSQRRYRSLLNLRLVVNKFGV